MRLTSNTKWLATVYSAAAILLVPWIVILWFTQPHRGVEHNADLLAGGIVGILAASTLGAGLLLLWSVRAAVVGAAFAGSFALATLWFRFTAQPIRPTGVPGSLRLAIVLLPFGLAVWSGARWLGRRAWTHRLRLLTALAYGVTALLVLFGAFHVASIVPQTTTEHHLRLVWTGLDIIELIGLTWTARCLATGSRIVVFAAPFTAAFLCSDAWTNVVSTAGEAQLAAIGMAVIELSLAWLSIVVAVRAASEPSGAEFA